MSDQVTPQPPTGEVDFSVEDSIDTTGQKGYSQGRLAMRRLLRHRAAMVSAVVLVFIILLAFTSVGFGPFPGWWDKSYLTPFPVQNGGAPTLQLWPLQIGEHPFGQNNIGRDYFAMVMRGTQRSLTVAFLVGIIATVIGTAIGAIAGYYRGIWESLLMRITDLFIIIPLIVLAAVLGSMVDGSNPYILAVVLGVVSWTGLARLVRGEVLSLREREFVAAARAIGTPSPMIVVRHILPNALGTIIVNATLLTAAAILTESALSYLEFGVRPPETSLGLLIAQNETALTTRPWLFWWPGLFILGIALTINFIGDGLRDAFDPRQRSD